MGSRNKDNSGNIGKSAEIIRFDDEKFKILYKLPAESPEGNKKAKLIYKACEIYHRVKEKQEEKCENKKSKL